MSTAERQPMTTLDDFLVKAMGAACIGSRITAAIELEAHLRDDTTSLAIKDEDIPALEELRRDFARDPHLFSAYSDILLKASDNVQTFKTLSKQEVRDISGALTYGIKKNLRINDLFDYRTWLHLNAQKTRYDMPDDQEFFLYDKARATLNFLNLGIPDKKEIASNVSSKRIKQGWPVAVVEQNVATRRLALQTDPALRARYLFLTWFGEAYSNQARVILGHTFDHAGKLLNKEERDPAIKDLMQRFVDKLAMQDALASADYQAPALPEAGMKVEAEAQDIAQPGTAESEPDLVLPAVTTEASHEEFGSMAELLEKLESVVVTYQPRTTVASQPLPLPPVENMTAPAASPTETQTAKIVPLVQPAAKKRPVIGNASVRYEAPAQKTPAQQTVVALPPRANLRTQHKPSSVFAAAVAPSLAFDPAQLSPVKKRAGRLTRVAALVAVALTSVFGAMALSDSGRTVAMAGWQSLNDKFAPVSKPTRKQLEAAEREKAAQAMATAKYPDRVQQNQAIPAYYVEVPARPLAQPVPGAKRVRTFTVPGDPHLYPSRPR